MKMKLWCDSDRVSWRMALGILLWAITLTPSEAQSNLVVNVGVLPPISTNLVGSTVVLSSTQDVQSVLFDYEWAKNGTKLIDGGRISGSSTPTLMITNSQVSDSAIYTISLYLRSVLEAMS